MSGAVTSVPVRQRLARDKRRGKIAALAVVALAAALLVALALSDEETSTVGSEQPVAVQSTGYPTPAPPVSGIRYDGGPEEGAVGTCRLRFRPASGTTAGPRRARAAPSPHRPRGVSAMTAGPRKAAAVRPPRAAEDGCDAGPRRGGAPPPLSGGRPRAGSRAVARSLRCPPGDARGRAGSTASRPGARAVRRP
jgi:hypothetical protein